MWIATQEGLDKFDGNNFVSYKRSALIKHRLSGTDIREIIEDGPGKSLWILSAENSVNIIDVNSGIVKRSLLFAQENPNDWNLSMCLIDKYLFIGSLVGVKVYARNDGSLITKLQLPGTITNSTDGMEARCIKSDASGNVWVSYGGYGIVIYDRAFRVIRHIPLVEMGLPPGKSFIRFNDMVFTSGSEVVLATNVGLRKVTFDKTYRFTIDNLPAKKASFLNNQVCEAVCKNKKGDIFVAGAKGLFRFDDQLQDYKVLQESQTGLRGGWMSDILKIFSDKEGNTWLGCEQGLGFISKFDNPFRSFNYADNSNERLDHVMGVCPSGDKIIVSLRNGLAVVNAREDTFTIYGRGHRFHHVFRDKNERVHVSRSDGMFIFDGQRLVRTDLIYPEFKQFISSPLNSHVFLGDSIIVLGTENNTGILLWNYVTHSVKSIDQYSALTPLASGIVNSVFLDSSGRLWVLSDNAVSIIAKDFKTVRNVIIYDSVFKQPAGLFFDMCEWAGYYWVTSYGSGLIQLDSALKVRKIYNTNDGLGNNGVYQVYSDKHRLFITTNNGLSVCNPVANEFQRYYHRDGLHSNGFEEAAGTMSNGVIYAGGVDGFTIIDPRFFSGNDLAPSLFIGRTQLETTDGETDSTNLELKYFEVPNNVLQTTIYFSGLNYTNPDRTIYHYRILEQSKEWINLNTQNFVTLVGLNPGKYHLEVKAANEDGIWSEPKELILDFQPKWFQTWWFKLMVFLATAGIIYAFYRYRIAQIKKQHEIRKNIATDLHDDLGSTLNSVKVFTNLAISGVQQEQSLQQVKSNLEEATMGLRDMIWVLDDSLDTVDELVTRLKQYAIPVTGASNMEFKVTTDFDAGKLQLTKEEKRNLFLVCKEVINNAIKYSGATLIQVGITPSGKKIEIGITDNGSGFDMSTIKKGYGLNNMQYRAGQIKYKVELISSPGKGTQITIRPS